MPIIPTIRFKKQKMDNQNISELKVGRLKKLVSNSKLQNNGRT